VFGFKSDEDGQRILKRHCNYFGECEEYCFGDSLGSNGDTFVDQREFFDNGIDEFIELDEERPEVSSRMPEKFSKELILIQEGIEKFEISKRSLDMRTKFVAGNQEFELEDVFKIYRFGLTAGLSTQSGNELLELIDEMFSKYHAKVKLPVRTWEAIRAMATRSTKELDVKRAFIMELPEVYFGKGDPQIPESKLESVRGHFFNIKYKLATYFLRIRPDQIKEKRDVKIREDGDFLLDGFDTGDRFKRFSDHNVSIDGTDTIHTMHAPCGDVIHIMLNISFDKAQVSVNQSMSLYPVTFNVLNIVGDESQFQLIGYCPLNLPYDDVTCIRCVNITKCVE
jgi:hypothetical protein